MEAIDVHAHIGMMDGFPQKGKEKELLFLTQDTQERMRDEAAVSVMMASAGEGIFPFGSQYNYRGESQSAYACTGSARGFISGSL